MTSSYFSDSLCSIVTAPEIDQESELSDSLRPLLARNLALSALIFVLLEFWRPLYFLTDDNLNSYFPLFTEIGQRLASGKSPFVSDYLFGGNYSLLHDSNFFLWHPVYLLASLLANTPAHFFILDVIAFFFLMLATAGFVQLAWFLRRELDLKLSDARLTFYALSFNYSMIILTTGSSWFNFLGNHSALPWLALGILQTSWRRGVGLVTLFSLHHILGGHFAVTLSNSIYLSLFAGGVAFYRHSTLPLISWFVGYALAIVILLPLLIPVWQGFSNSARAEGLTYAVMSKYAMPAGLFPFSYFLATFSALLPFHYEFGMTHIVYTSGFVSCAAGWALIPAMISRARWNFLEILCLGLCLFIAVMVIRPAWVSEIMLQLPLFKSMRWPFRDILQFQFFLHLFLVLRPPGGSLLFQRWTTLVGCLIFIVPLPCLEAPTFNTMRIDRQLVLSGGVQDYWDRVRPLIGPDSCIAAVGSLPKIGPKWRRIPFSLLGAYNYPILAKIRSVTGYSATPPLNRLYVDIPPDASMCLYSPEQVEEILRERPNVKCIELKSVEPLTIVLHSLTGPDIDLSPFIPQDKFPKPREGIPEE